ncbi:MerR family transcriptional regulator [Fictibacillus iocasae]|uniref:MerR family transcriptional regulator n=1 Tax=Fictibacillus iocasae TaxID=2715437 RepID=A0ABW2NJK2_9BACL
MFSISEVSNKLGISTHTLRYYEKEKIITPSRNPGGDRLYSDQDLAWLQFVIKLKQTKMPIASIRTYASLFTEGKHTAIARLELLETHRASLLEQMKTLAETEKMLDKKIKTYKDILKQEKSDR